MSRQTQDVEGGAVAIQGGRDVSVQYGPNAQQLGELITGISSQLAIFHAEGQSRVEERLDKFREEMMREVDARTCDAGALKDPDFQYATGQAQKGFVRTDDEVIAASLINLLAERSQYVERSRASLSLNGAIEVVGNLTSEEIAGLTAVFVISRAILKTSIPQILYVNFNKYTSSLTESMTQESGSIEYLLSHGCVTRNQFPGPDLFSTIRDIYILAFSDGFILSDFEKEFPEIDADTATKILIRLRAPGLGAPVNYTSPPK